MASVQERRPRALAEIGLNAIYSLENNTSSDDEPSPAAQFRRSLEENDAQSIVGVSLGPQQSRLNSVRTPAREKTSAIKEGGGFFDVPDVPDVPEDAELLVDADERARRLSRYESMDKITREELHKASNDNLRTRQARAQSVIVLPAHRETDRTTLAQNEQSPLTASSDDTLVASTSTSSKAAPSRPAPGRISTQLVRSTSDDSLQIRSSISRVSTLGDDSRFDHVKEQVNSRAKAIRDSVQDSNIRFPSFPSLPSLPSLTSLSAMANLRMERMSLPFRRGSSSHRNSLTFGRSGSRTPSPGRSLTPTPAQTARHAMSAGTPYNGGPTSKIATTHPHFTKACAETMGDLVILGGYRGSVLRSAEPPHRQLWVPVKVGLNIRKVDMEVGLNVPEDDMKMESKIFPDCMLSHIGPVDISRRLFKRLRACDNAKTGRLRVHDYGYDWRLDPEYLSGRLIQFLERLPCNQPGTPRRYRGATVIAHSLGGLITRNAVNKRPDLFAGVVYAGTPTTCVNILGPLRNGDDVLLSSRVLTAQVNFSIRTSFALLPLDGKCFFNKDTGEQFPVDFFDPQTWLDYRLSPCVARPLPPLVPPPTGMLEGWKSSLMSALPSVQSSVPTNRSTENTTSEPSSPHEGGIGPSVNAKLQPSNMEHVPSSSVATTVTISRDQAMAYLTTMLARVKKFKQDTQFRADHQKANAYPPAAVIFGKSIPTVHGAKVRDREAIKHSDAYDNLAFGSGDGVVLARAAMLPDGYEVAQGGVVSSERGHITLLGDLESVGRALNAVRRAREKGVGLGVER